MLRDVESSRVEDKVDCAEGEQEEGGGGPLTVTHGGGFLQEAVPAFEECGGDGGERDAVGAADAREGLKRSKGQAEEELEDRHPLGQVQDINAVPLEGPLLVLGEACEKKDSRRRGVRDCCFAALSLLFPG